MDDAEDFQAQFWATKRVMASAWATAFARHGVHEGQQFVLQTLWATDGLTPGEIARRLGLSTPTVTRATSRMEASGLLRRERDEHDRRLVRVYLTDRGKTLEDVIAKELDGLNERALASFDADARAALLRALREIRSNLR